MRVAALVALAFAIPVPAWAQASDQYEAAVSARLSGQPQRAVELLKPIIAVNPDNADAQVQFGLALLALGQLDGAQHAFEAALAVAPSYADARLGLARIAQRRGQVAQARAELDRLPSDNVEAAELQGQLQAAAQSESRWILDVDGNYSTLSGAQPDWRELHIRLRHFLSPKTAIGGSIQIANRFGSTDVYSDVTVDFALNDHVRGYIAVGGTPEADFLPRWQISSGGSVRLTDGGSATVFTLDARQAEYVSGNIQTVSPGFEQYVANGRVWLTGRWINTFDETGHRNSGFLVRSDALVSDRVRLFVGYSDASDTASGVVIDTRVVFGGAVVKVGRNTTLRLSAAQEDRATGAKRTEIAVGVGFGF